MRVKIKRYEKRSGFFFRKRLFFVETSVAFTEQEKQIIKLDNNGRDRVIMERTPSAHLDVRMRDDPTDYWLYIEPYYRRRPDKYCCTSLVRANAYEVEFREAILKLTDYFALGGLDTVDTVFEA